MGGTSFEKQIILEFQYCKWRIADIYYIFGKYFIHITLSLMDPGPYKNVAAYKEITRTKN